MKDLARSEPANEPVLAHAPGSPERALLDGELARQAASIIEAPLWLGGEAVSGANWHDCAAPHRHELVIGRFAEAEPSHVDRAVRAALEARAAWAGLDLESRARVFLRAAELLSGPWRMRLLAATMRNQSKTVHQAEIDAACELSDFLRFNAHFAAGLADLPLVSPPGEQNRFELRPLDGFVFAVTPFNFTAIAGNLPTAPALLGNTVVWKPSPLAALSAQVIIELLHAAGLPPGVINLVQGDAAAISERVIAHPDFGGLHFTGSTQVLRKLWQSIGSHIQNYRAYPRIVGETGGKDFIVAHTSADVTALAVAVVRGGFEYQGQKCSAPSRVYVPRSLAPRFEAEIGAMLAQIRVGDPIDPRNFLGAVISRSAFSRIRAFQTRARTDPACRIAYGGGADDREGFFVEPTLVESQDPKHSLMTEEIFGPLVTFFVYDDDRFAQVLELCDTSTPYALTGAVFARDRAAIELASATLKMAAGNFYINDKPTGAVVGQQPFGGGRLSGTNDKAGSFWNLMRWASPRAIKENLSPPHDFRYPFLQSDPRS